jgi:hypothetical protein
MRRHATISGSLGSAHYMNHRVLVATATLVVLSLGVGCGEIVSDGKKRPEVPVCAAACGTHQVCAFVDQVSPDTACSCAVGYTDAAGACTWQGGGANRGGLRDGKLNDPTAWESALIDFNPTAFGPTNGSVAFKTAFGLCGESVLRQTFDMPEYKDAEPLVLEMQYLSQAMPNQPDGGAVVRFNGSDQIIPIQARNGTARLCLGANAYGRGVTFELVPLVPAFPCTNGQDPPVSRLFRTLEIKPAAPGECTAPGAFANPTFTTDTAGWTFSTTNTRVANLGGVLRVAATAGYGQISASTSLSIPPRAVLPNAALRFKYNTALGNADYMTALRYLRRIDILLGQQNLGLLFPTDGARPSTASFCVPDWAYGMAYTLTFVGASPSNTLFPEGPTDYYYMFLDELELVTDSTCSFDGGFERPANQSSWNFDIGGIPRAPLPTGFVLNPLAAHTGNVALDFEPPRDPGYYPLAVSRWLKVPAISGTAKPVLKFWQRAAALAPFALSTFPVNGAAPTAVWEQQSLCIPPRLAGHLQQFRWTIAANADAAVHHYYLDDVELTTSTSCQ